MTKTATWNGTILAKSDKTIVVEGNHYFPQESLTKEYLRPSPTHTTCGLKGVASYYTVDVDGEINKDAAWYYPTPKDGSKHIANHVAFWRGVVVS